MYTETHQCIGSHLPTVHGYRWESVCRPQPRTAGGTRGSGGVAILYKQELQGAIQVVHRDAEARYLWVRIHTRRPKDIYIAVCYFSPAHSRYASQGESPYMPLYEDIVRYASMGDILLAGDFNARTGQRQSSLYDREDPMYQELPPNDMGIQRAAQDTGDLTEYGTHLLALGSAHGLIIYNGLSRWPGSDSLTCWNRKGGASTVDYLMGSLTLIPDIQNFSISRRPIGVAADHAYLTFSLAYSSTGHTTPSYFPKHPRYHFSRETSDIYISAIYDGLLAMDPHGPLEELTRGLTEVLHIAAGQAFPHTTVATPTPPRSHVPQNSWYDNECREMRNRLQREVTLGARTHKQAQTSFRRLVRKKKRDFLAQQEAEIYQLFLGQDSEKAWRMFQERSPPTPIAAPGIWHTYARTLYEVPGQPPTLPPTSLRPTHSTFYTPHMVVEAIDRLHNGRAQDHEGLVAEHFIHARDTIAPILAWMFNRAMCEGFPSSWSDHTIVPLLKSGDPMMPTNYRTIMIGHCLAKIYGSILEHELSSWTEKQRLRAQGQAGFRRGHTTLDHILTLRTIIEEGRARGRRIYCCFVDFRKAFDTVPRARLMRRLQDLGVPEEMRWGIYALYEFVTGRVRAPEGLSDTVTSTIGVKQGCPLSPTLFGLYIDEISDYLDRLGGPGASLAGTLIPILLYADDIVLIADSPEDLQRHLDALQSFCRDRDLTVNLGKTKVMVFNTTQAWVTRAEHQFTLRGEVVECVRSYVYLGVTFKGPQFSMREAADARLTRGFAALGALERQCAHIQFQEPRTKLWLFDTLVTPTLLYGAPIWGPSLYHTRRDPLTGQDGPERDFYDGWQPMERPLVTMIAHMIRSKPSTPHEIIRAELGAAPVVTEALLQTVTFLRRIGDLPQQRYPRLALDSSRQLSEEGDTRCWYTQVQTWLSLHGMSMDTLPPFQYSLDCPFLDLSHSELNRVMRMDIIRLDTERTWITPTLPLRTKMAQYQSHFLHISPDGFILRPTYMDTHLSHGIRSTIGQIRTSSHHLRIETGRSEDLEPADRICQLCYQEAETEEHYICRCTVYYEIRGRYHCLFREGFGPLRKVMEYEDQRCLGLFLLELRRHREGLLRDRRTPPPDPSRQRRLTDFFGAGTSDPLPRSPTPPSPHPPPSRRVAPCGVTLDRAIALCRARRPRPPGPRPPRLHHGRIRAIICRHRRRIPRYTDISILQLPMGDFLS